MGCRSASHRPARRPSSEPAKTAAGTPDFSLLVDGLAAEREQGITIDIAWRYFDTRSARRLGRRLVIIDSPGHEQYTRNMATGASHADVAILLVDARTGVKVQTRRHAAILDLMGVARVVLAVNKMDLVDWSEARFRDIEAEFLTLAAASASATRWPSRSRPCSATTSRAARSTCPGTRAGRCSTHLQQVPGRQSTPEVAPDTITGGSFRFPVQMVVRAGQDFRGLAGTVASGEIAVGDEVVDAVSGRRARVRRIVTMGRDLDSASAGQAVVLQLDTDIDVSRGAVLAAARRGAGRGPQPRRAAGVALRRAVRPRPRLSAAHRDRPRPGSRRSISAAHLDLATLTERPASTCAANDIAVARIQIGRAPSSSRSRSSARPAASC